MKKLDLACLLTLILSACAQAEVLPTVAPPPAATSTPHATVASTPSPTATSTPDPYEPYTIEYLRARDYGGGEIEIVEYAGQNSAFTRYLIRYPSDDLFIHGFANVPKGEGPFPVVIALHGYVDPSVYETYDYTTQYADALASSGYIVLHPNLRGYAPSDDGDNLFRVGMAIDVLNLIALVKPQSGRPGLLETADPERIGLWGHSMGGGIATRVITVSPDVKAAVLYAAMSGDEEKNYEAIFRWLDGRMGQEELSISADQYVRISPMYFFEDITAAVSIHHGMEDELVPLRWATTTCEALKALGKQVECHYYEDMPHTFHAQGDKLFIRYTILFFDRTLASP